MLCNVCECAYESTTAYVYKYIFFFIIDLCQMHCVQFFNGELLTLIERQPKLKRKSEIKLHFQQIFIHKEHVYIYIAIANESPLKATKIILIHLEFII